jgi:hypothetical protein
MDVARFHFIRWRTLVLALSVSLALGTLLSHPTAAQVSRVGEPPGIGGLPPPTSGDPDVPATGGAKVKPGALRKGGNLAGRTVGDGLTTRSVWMWRLRVVAQGMRKQYFRF